MSQPSRKTGAVAIGRNEGERLEACLQSLVGSADQVVYVDSGSTDDSVTIARRLGVDVVDLDTTIPFTAARARNAGYERLSAVAPLSAGDYVQFVDGDCEVVGGWLEEASAFLDANDEVAAVCGRRRERSPERSVYNLLCDIEWAGVAGDVKSTGGDFMIRVAAFDAVDGFNPTLIAGEEPDLCFRLREKGWRIWRLDAEMTLHDAAMTRLSQWWRRNKRAGYAYAAGFDLHGASPEKFRRREVWRAAIFGGALPVGILVATIVFGPIALIGFLVYPAQIFRTYSKTPAIGQGRLAYAVSCTFAKVAEFFGVLNFISARLRGRSAALIEYK